MHKMLTCLTALILLQFSALQVAASDPMLDIANEYEVFFRDLYREQWKTMLSSAHYGLGWRVSGI